MHRPAIHMYNLAVYHAIKGDFCPQYLFINAHVNYVRGILACWSGLKDYMIILLEGIRPQLNFNTFII